MHRLHSSTRLVLLLAGLALSSQTLAQQPDTGNRPERLEWFADQGLGMFIHWSLDSRLGSVISHSMVGASPEYLIRYVETLPRMFNPDQFDPDKWAEIAQLAGMKYVVFTTKHHNGFTMFDSETTDFSVMSTPYGRDITAQVVEAFREKGIAVGFYFSPDDFHFLYEQGTLISRRRPEALPVNNPELLAHDQAQLRELMRNYGPVDVLFIDGPAEGLREVAWEEQPNVVITRGAIETPEQTLPGEPLPVPWEACFTLGTQWQFKPTNESYKSGTELIEMLIETRAKGGNLLLNIGPEPNGVLPREQEGVLRELALWMFVNDEAIHDVRPWTVTNEDSVWFTRDADDPGVVYAFLTGADWPLGKRRTITLHSVAPGEDTTVSVLGQNDRVLEYHPNVNPETTWEYADGQLDIRVMRAQRLYNDRSWPNPIVLRLTGVQPADTD